jgi:CDP-glycerol glycerophosphotransferase (TagB/SpsB family)
MPSLLSQRYLLPRIKPKYEMATPEEIIHRQAEQIETLKKAISVLDSRLRRLEQRERSAASAINNNARDIRQVAVQVENIKSAMQRGG